MPYEVPQMQQNGFSSLIPPRGTVQVNRPNAYEAGVDVARQRGRQDTQDAAAVSSAAIKRKNEVFQQMLEAPESAEQIAQMNGMPLDDNMRQIFSNKEAVKKLTDGLSLAKSYGITDQKAISAFTNKYVETGNHQQAFDATAGMELNKPQQFSPYAAMGIDLRRQQMDANNDYRNDRLELDRQKMNNQKPKAVPTTWMKAYDAGIEAAYPGFTNESEDTPPETKAAMQAAWQDAYRSSGGDVAIADQAVRQQFNIKHDPSNWADDYSVEPVGASPASPLPGRVTPQMGSSSGGEPVPEGSVTYNLNGETITQQEIDATAAARGMTSDQVKAALGIR